VANAIANGNDIYADDKMLDKLADIDKRNRLQ